MSVNLLEEVRKNLDYPPLQKIDPNTSQAEKNKTPTESDIGQAAIPATLAGLYRLIQSDEGAGKFLNPVANTNWVDAIFHDYKNEVTERIAAYGHRSERIVRNAINSIALECHRIVREQLSISTPEQLKHYFHIQLPTILLYLPPQIHAGEWVFDNTLDDNINKMKGPVSSWIQKVGAMFSNPVNTKHTD